MRTESYWFSPFDLQTCSKDGRNADGIIYTPLCEGLVYLGFAKGPGGSDMFGGTPS